jgi:protein-S-isoprenylcysteine O-methyltransferase Ste14
MMERKRTIAWALFKTAVFTLVVPGTIGVFLPRWLLSQQGRNQALPPISWRWTGLLPLVAGACIYLACAWDFAVTGLGTPAPIDMPRRLVVKGPYRFVRNPMYVGVAWVVLGQALLFGSSALAIYIASFWTLAHLFVIFHEEPTLHRKFGAEYEEYCARVPRWLPRLS